MQLPEFLEQGIIENKTSLGDHPAFPPEDEDVFIASIIRNMYSSVMKGIETDDRKELGRKLSELVSECKKEEECCKEALEKLCSNMLATIFSIPDDTINIDGSLVNECDMSKYRMVPDSTPDFEFNDIHEMRHLSDIIYQRRMINCLMSGASLDYANNFDTYVQEVWKINPRLISLYSEIYKYNLALLFNQPDSIKAMERSNSGCVTVIIGNEDERISIDAQGVIFPILLEYAIRGILEIASMKGLPKDQSRTEYVLGKSDYRLAENWDMRIGIPLWKILRNIIEETGFDVDEIGANFVIMELSKLEPDVFNGYLQNVFKKTKLGKQMTAKLIEMIEYKKESDEFDNFIKVNNEKYAINDSEEYTSEELLEEI